MTAKRKRPKVRYVIDGHRYSLQGLFAIRPREDNNLPRIYTTNRVDARQVAAALNLYEAARRREI